LNELRNVVLVLTKRWHVNVKDVETVVKILSEFALRDGLVRDFDGGGEDPDIH
jgi:hypothetical protein